MEREKKPKGRRLLWHDTAQRGGRAARSQEVEGERESNHSRAELPTPNHTSQPNPTQPGVRQKGSSGGPPQSTTRVQGRARERMEKKK